MLCILLKLISSPSLPSVCIAAADQSCWKACTSIWVVCLLRGAAAWCLGVCGAARGQQTWPGSGLCAGDAVTLSW